MPCARGCCATQREHYLSVRLSAEATPSKQSSHYKQTTARDKSWPKDHAAYRRLRKDGVQPDHINGSAELEAAL